MTTFIVKSNTDNCQYSSKKLSASYSESSHKVSSTPLLHYKELDDKGYNSASFEPTLTIQQKLAYCEELRETALHKTPKAGALYAKRGCSCAYCEAIREVQELIGSRNHEECSLHTKRDTKSELREFYSDMRKRSTYVGLGDEASMCGSYGQLCECEVGHLTLKNFYDGREWCPRCGKNGSDAHKRRTMRMVDRAYSMNFEELKVGYMVLEISVPLRGYFEDSHMLRKAREYAKRMLKRELVGINGVCRWHYYGDDAECRDYKPHLNILHDYGFVRKRQLKRIRLLWSKWQYEACGKHYYKIATVWNRYTRSEGKLWHWLSYINRATFKTLHDGNRHIARSLFKFNNCSWLGKFSEASKALGRERFEAWRATLPQRELVYDFDIEAHELYDSGHCAVCGALTHGIGRVQLDDYEILHDYGAGLYHVADRWEYALLEAELRLANKVPP